MNKIKSLLCFVIVIGGLFCSTPGLATESFVSNIFVQNQLSTEQWFQDKSTRAACTVFAAIGFVKNSNDLIFEDLEDYLANPSWIGISKSKNQIMTVGYLGINKITIYIAVITPKTGKIEYTTIDMSSSKKEDMPKIVESLIPSILEAQYATSEYYENDLEEIANLMKQLYGDK